MKDFGIVIIVIIAIVLFWFMSGISNSTGSLEGLVVPSLPSLPQIKNATNRTTDEKIGENTGLAKLETIVVDGKTYYKSRWFGQIKLGRGNAKSAYQPREEYITLQNSSKRGSEAINITGWLLQNNDANRLFEDSGRLYAGNTNRAYIPSGVEVLLPENNQAKHWINLKPGDRAIVVTGNVYSSGKFKIKSSFRVNKCSGYLENLPNYNFTPTLKSKCPSPKEVEGLKALPETCYNLVRRLPRCETPDIEPYRDRDGDLVRRHINGNTEVSRFCQEFVVANFSYGACVAVHYNDDDFLTSDWRIFLDKNWEMWKNDRDIIYLFDDRGHLVSYLAY